MRPPFVLPMRDILRQLETEPRFAPNVTALRELPARPAEYGPWPEALHPDLRRAAEQLGITEPYRHQSEAIGAALAGRDVATVAGTAAGKSLCYLLPMMDSLLRHPEARAILIFPTKALAHDQLAALRIWDAALPDAALRPAAYDGDTPRGARGQARRQARILVTNPDMLHAGILPHHPRWADFLGGLSDVVLDEMHVYRGVFGSHVANLLRRLRRVVDFHAAGRGGGAGRGASLELGHDRTADSGSKVDRAAGFGDARDLFPEVPLDPGLIASIASRAEPDTASAQGALGYGLPGRPRFAFGSATIGNPAELAAHLAGRPVQVVGEDGAPRGRRSFLIYNPPVIDAALNIRRSAVLEAEQLARHCLAAGVQTIAFARSRQGAELLLRYLTEGLAREGLTGRGPKGEENGPLVRGYRGGYRAGERREIEADLREGRLRGVVATNALELGIDIGELDACVMLGYPGSIASTWQQAGRAGRRGGESLALLVAGASPLDQFIARHPDYLFDRSAEQARIDPDNLLILLDHIRCAAFELPFDAEEADRSFGETGDMEARIEGMGKALRIEQEGLGSLDAPADREADSSPPASTSSTAPKVAELLAVLEAQGQIQYAGGSWYWLAEAYPAGAVSLRSAGPTAVAVILGDPPGESGAVVSEGSSDKRSGGMSGENPTASARSGEPGSASTSRADGRSAEVLGTVERSSAPTMLHPGAVYLHAGEAYEVQALDLDASRAWLRPSDGSIYTRASSRVDIRPLSQAAARPAQGVDLAWGELEVRSRATGYRRIRFRSHETLGWGKIDLPEQQHVAGGYWFTLRDETVDALRELGRWQHDPLRDRGRDWPKQAALARARDGNRCQLCDAPEREGRAHDVHHIRPYRSFGDGPGSEANQLDNLITLCKACHRVAERALGLHGGLQGLGHALGHVAPLFLMCDDRDIGVKTESHAAWSKRPTVVVYERAAAGLGFGEALFGLHPRLIAAATELIADCPCALGCPSCVGPAGEQGPDAKAHAVAVLRALA